MNVEKIADKLHHESMELAKTHINQGGTRLNPQVYSNVLIKAQLDEAREKIAGMGKLMVSVCERLEKLTTLCDAQEEIITKLNRKVKHVAKTGV